MEMKPDKEFILAKQRKIQKRDRNSTIFWG
jgi:hypothetical protein